MSVTLSPLDATFLELEDADPAAHMHVGAVMVFDPLPDGGVPSPAELRAHLLRRLEATPRFHERLSSPHTGSLTWPCWVPEDLDTRAHVRHARLRAPGDESQLTEWAARYWSTRLDRSRPLWEITLLEGLAGGRWALCTKTHHCMVDGIASIDVAHLLLDASPDVTDELSTPLPSPAAEGPGHHRLGALLGVPASLVRGARASVSVATHPQDLWSAAQRSKALAELIVRDEIVGAPQTSLNAPIGESRRYTAVEVPLEDLKAIKRRLGGTINDVVLTAATGGLRALLEHRGEELPSQGLRAMVPMNVRQASEHLALGNRISSLFVNLPVAEPLALARYARVLDEVERLKSGSQPLGSDTILKLTALAPPILHAGLAQTLFGSRLFNVTVTNVPGPPATLYAFGAPLRRVMPLVPLAADHAVGIAVVSYDGTVTFGVVADRDSVKDLDILADGLHRSLEELGELVSAHEPPAHTTASSTDSAPPPGAAGVQAVREYLKANAVPHRMIEHAEAFSALTEAEAAGAEPRHTAKVIVLRDGDANRLAVLPATRRLDLAKASRALHAKQTLRLATEQELAHDFPAFDVGSLPPFGPPAPAPEVIDGRLLDGKQILCPAGDHHHSLLLDARVLLRLTHPTTHDICQVDPGDVPG